jgi:CRISPR/Cas system-associated endonuclease/helicase Cas3
MEHLGFEVQQADGTVELKYKTPKYYYHNNPEARERMKETSKKQYYKLKTENPDALREKARNAQKKKYDNDAEFRSRKNEYNKQMYYKRKALKALQTEGS